MTLLIVESPTKARTLSKFLGKDYAVESTTGHVRDLPKSKLGVDVDHNFTPDYVLVKGKREVMRKLRQQALSAKQILLATDPDREGEAIAWHVYHLFKENSKFPFKKKTFGRIVFHEITKSAVEDAIKHTTDINLQLVDAQQARRVLDRLVGYKLSPLLWKKVRRGLSAGRVQSVAVRLIVDREKEREAFKPEEFWVIGADLRPIVRSRIEGPDSMNQVNDPGSSQTTNVFWAELKKKAGKTFQAKSKKEADPVIKDLKKATYQVTDVKRREVKKSAPPPFTTSTLQQRAASKFGWSAKRTMRSAQRLYEQGLITYHRTDSLNLAAKAITAVRKYIPRQFGKQYLPEKPNYFKTKSKLAQEAHEAIRPTDVHNTSASSGALASQSSKNKTGAKNPKNKSTKFSNPADQSKLYHLIWQRFVACQMTPAVWDETRAIISASPSRHSDRVRLGKNLSNSRDQRSRIGGSDSSNQVNDPGSNSTPDYTLTTSGRTEKFLGWRLVYHSDNARSRIAGSDSSNQINDPESKSDRIQTPISRHSELASPRPGRDPESSKQILKPVQNDATPALPSLTQDQPLDLLKVTSEQKFTQPPPRYGVASLIKELEKLGIGRPSTYAPIISTIQERQYVELQDKSFVPTPVGLAVTEFLLRNFPQVMDYQFTAGMEENLDHIAQGDKQWVPVIRDFYTPFSDKLTHVEANSQRVKIATEKTGDKCPECKTGDVVIRVGRFGKFLSCSRFPECKYTANFVEKINMKCPKCEEGEVIIKTTKKRRKFFGCSRYPDCDWASWSKPKSSD